MRTYPRNSPQAAARIVALAAVCDGHLSRTELQVLEALNADQLGISTSELHDVVKALCEDLLAHAYPLWGTACQLGPALDSVLAELDEPELQRTTLALCAAVANADNHWSEAENTLLGRAAVRWAPLPPTNPALEEG